MQYGVGGTSLTGSYTSPPPTQIIMQSVSNNFDGTYNVTFSQNVTVNSASADTNLPIYNQATNSFQYPSNATQISPNVVQYTVAFAGGPNNYWFVNGQPLSVLPATGGQQFGLSPYQTTT